MSKNKTTDQDLDFLVGRLRSDLPRLQREDSVRSLGLFGSYIRGKQEKGSDLDILVEFEEVPGMVRFLDLEWEISQLHKVPVYLVQKEALKPAIGKRILQEVLTV